MEEKIIDLLDEKFAEPEFEDCFWLDVKLHQNKKLEVIIDSDTGVTFSTCQQISRYLEGFIDEAGWLGEKYVLEVSSPGVDRPLQQLRQYPKNIGRKLEVKMKDGTRHEGKLVEVAGEIVSLEAKVRRKDGKRKVTETVRTDLPFGDIDNALVKISFK
ncbi:MAG: ribosome maturation factor [Lewinella sp.]|nr:ribosome maturation factor [Lewinella sp.]